MKTIFDPSNTSHLRTTTSKLPIIAAVSIAALGLSACSTMGAAGGQHHGMNAEEGCAQYRETMAGKSPTEQRAAAEAHIAAMHGAVDPAHVDRHLRMMEQMCGPKAGAGAISR